MNQVELEQEILRQEGFIEEEQRCLNFCLSNPEVCEESEIEEREVEIGKLLEKLEYTKGLLNNLKQFEL